MKITIQLVRDVTMLALGAGGMAQEFFLAEKPDQFRVYVCIGLLMGPTFILGAWQAWVARQQQQRDVASLTPTHTVEQSSSPPSP